ncbi:Rqc2 RqcH [Candidatus Entotheonellaceae bacterium PAL068K]
MDIFVLQALVNDLRPRLLGTTVSKVFQMNRDDLLLRLWRGRDLRLFLSTQPTLQRLHLTTQRFANPQRPPRFAAFLRAHLHRTRLQDITMQPYDRLVHLTWERAGLDGSALTLIHELMGPHANIVLADHRGTVLEALRHVHPDDTHRRPVLPGHPYQPPQLPPQRLRVPALTREHLVALQRQGTFDVPHLRRLLIGVSPVLLTELLYRSQGDPQAYWELFQYLRQAYETNSLTLSLSTTSEGARHLSVLPLTYCTASTACFASIQEAVAAYYEPMMQRTDTEAKRRTAHKTLRQRQQKLRKKMANLQRDYQTLQSYLPYQQYGTLLMAQRLPRGTASATVVDYYHPDQATIVIPLDPRLSGRGNAQQYFKKYCKATSGLVKVQTLLEQCSAEAKSLEDLAQRLAEAEDPQTLYTVAAEICQAPRGVEARQRQVVSPRAATAQSYRTFVSRNGYTLYCGKNDHGNDLLWRQVATPNDIWLHAHYQAGAHVIIKVRPQQDVPHATLAEAASLAAFYSQGKHATSVEVIYTRAKHVQSFRGACPGQVRVTTYRSLQVAPRRSNA